MEAPGLVDRLLVPLTWLERSKGWKRGALLLLYVLAASVAGLLSWRSLSLWRLPDIGDPFDPSLGVVEVPDAANAMLPYREAARLLVPPALDRYRVTTQKAWDSTSWATAEPEVHRWVADNRPALAAWRRGADRPDSLAIQPRDLDSRSHMVAMISLQEFPRLALLEASRLEEEGDFEGAWSLYRATLRASRHAGMHSGAMPRWIGNGFLARARAPVMRWIEETRVTPGLLRRAIADVEECRRMTPANSEMIRAEYFNLRSTLVQDEAWRYHPIDSPEGDGTWYNHIAMVPETRMFLLREPERSLRALKLLVAGQLAQCDRPRAVRPQFASKKYAIYRVDDRTPRALASLTPEELEAWVERSTLRNIMGFVPMVQARLDAERGQFDAMILKMAERAFEVERGHPPRVFADLVGPYLKALPDEIEPGDLIRAGPAPE